MDSATRTTYLIGPTLAPTEQPWPISWESDPRIDDGHEHLWECCLLQADGRYRVRIEEVVRCRGCHVPRCGHSRDRDPCLRRRHHRTAHVLASGRVEPMGFEPVGQVP
jgi:hypothetical protein